MRGTHVVNIINYVKDKRGVIGLEQLWEKMRKKRGEIKKDYTKNEFVDYELIQDFFEAVEELFGDELKDIPRSREIGRHIAENLGHFEFLTRGEGLKELVNKAEENWNQVYKFGRIELADWGDNRAVVRYHGFPADENVCNYFQGSLEKDLEMVDLDGKIEHTGCPIEDDDYMEFTITW